MPLFLIFYFEQKNVDFKTGPSFTRLVGTKEIPKSLRRFRRCRLAVVDSYARRAFQETATLFGRSLGSIALGIP